MSKAYVVEEDITALAKGMAVNAANLFRSMGKIGFPKDYGTLSVSSLGVDSMPAQNTEMAILLDGPIGFFGGRPGIEQSLDSLLQTSSPLGDFMPLDSHPPMLQRKVPSKRDVQRPVEKSRKMIHQLPLSQGSPPQIEEVRQNVSQDDLKNIQVFFEQNGLAVREVKLLPSGTTRITLDDLLKSQKVRQAEFARVGGRR